MTRTLTLLLFSIILLHAKERPFLIQTHKPFDSVLYDVTQNYDGSLTAVGFSNRYKQINKAQVFTDPFSYLAAQSEHTYGKKAFLLNFNAQDAKTNFERFAKIPEFSEAVSVLKTPQNGYFIGGFTLEGSLLVAKLNANGDTLFVKRFGTKNYDRLNALVALSDGGVLAVGSSSTTRDPADPMFLTGLGLNDIFITRLNASGKILWSRKYGTQFDDKGIDAAEARDGTILVLAATKYEKHHDVTLMRLAQNGDKIWLKHFMMQTLLNPKKMIPLLDGNFLAVLSQKDNMGKKQIRLIKFDLEQNLLQDVLVPTYYESELNDISEYSNSRLIGVGSTKDRYNTDAYVAIFDENFDILCQEHFGSENFDTFYGVTILRDSSAVAVGTTTPKNSQVKQSYIAKITPECTLAKIETSSSSANANDLYTALQKLFAKEIQNGDITLGKDLSISFSAPALLFRQGEYRLTPYQKKFIRSFSKKFIPFLLQHKDRINQLEIIGHTSSEWQRDSKFSKRYLKNMDLSLKRSYSVTTALFLETDSQTQQKLVPLLKDSGRSFADKIERNGVEDKMHSRRVVFTLHAKRE